MNSANSERAISIIIPSRARPKQLQTALDSVLAQSNSELLDVIVVLDGVHESAKAAYNTIINEYENEVRFITLPYRLAGHGPSFARNEGILHAKGRYVGFLDDDDEWTDQHHLERFFKLTADERVDLYFTHQKAVRPDGEIESKEIWLEGLIDKYKECEKKYSSCRIDVDTLLSTYGFSHLNCTLVSKELIQEVGLFDESIRYEEDRHIYFILLERAKYIWFSDRIIGNHYIPIRDSASTRLSKVNRIQSQITAASNLFDRLQNEKLLERVREILQYSFEELSEIFLRENSLDKAYLYRVYAAGCRATLKNLYKIIELRLKILFKSKT